MLIAEEGYEVVCRSLQKIKRRTWEREYQSIPIIARVWPGSGLYTNVTHRCKILTPVITRPSVKRWGKAASTLVSIASCDGSTTRDIHKYPWSKHITIFKCSLTPTAHISSSTCCDTRLWACRHTGRWLRTSTFHPPSFEIAVRILMPA